MRPTPIPDEEIWPGHKRIVLGPPEGSELDGDIRAVEMLVGIGDSGMLEYSARFVLEDGELERLQAGEPFWLTLLTGVIPFDISMTEQDG